jgi:outer membrane lipase/esterase
MKLPMTPPMTPSITTLTRALRALALCALAASASAQAGTFSRVVVFGDSLSDNGNLFALTSALFGPANALPQADAYFQGRFSNGPAAVEVMAQALGTSLTNFAYGGATTGLGSGPLPGLPVNTGVLGQVATYAAQLGGGPADPSALYVVWGGPNDFEYLGATPAVAQQAVVNLAQAVGTLHTLGARRFLLPNLPDLGLTPAAALQPPGTAAALSALSTQFNAALEQSYAQLAAVLPGVTFYGFDVADLQRRIAQDPPAFGFTDVTTPCFGGYVGVPGPQCADPAGRFYWDVLHPSAQAHALLGGQLAAAVPEPGAGLLLALGLAALGWRLRGAGAAARDRAPA